MKIKSLMLFALCFVLFACGENFDEVPVTSVEDKAGTLGTVGNNPGTSSFNIPTNFVLVNGSNDEALLNFGVSPNMSEVVTIKPKFSVKLEGSNSFAALPPMYNDLVIQPNNQLSNVITVRRQDWGICKEEFTLRMEVDEVRIGGVLVPASGYNVLTFSNDGTTDLEMTGPGCPPGGQGQPGYVSKKDFTGSDTGEVVIN